MANSNSKAENSIKKAAKAPTDLLANTKDIWPDGWFISNGDAIKGPFSAEQVFEKNIADSFDDFTHTRSDLILVSRKGFKKWYVKDDLTKLYLEGSSLSSEVEKSFKEDLKSELRQIEDILSSVKDKNPSKAASEPERKNIVVKKTLGPSALSNASPRKSEVLEKERAALEKVAGASFEPVNKGISAAKKVAKKVAGSTEDLQDKKIIADAYKASVKADNNDHKSSNIEKRRSEAKLAASEVRNFTPSKENSFSYYHMILRGRLRLGDIKKPSGELFKSLLCLGLNTPFYITSAKREVMWHIDPANKVNSSFFKSLLMLIPILNLVFYKNLANDIIEMEKQNNYKSVSVAVTLLLSLVPPFANFYLQKKINNHWRLHALCVMKKESKV